ncbi:ABC transporter permease [Pontibacillus litoralis]|uniref:ABC3 transporter permease C-terminal domain-containing protein n=1 Tax=Pontibacillus litoralis JSM 072002 TaxID=1385512 RepID=A0A0A5G759_9BACI|nr:FtsX-like permease family protein [Pontibacillus litoralis]KGX86935.1 hypothetical protein N784_03030 [Pontibacillus litoralis JSM 072002]
MILRKSIIRDMKQSKFQYIGVVLLLIISIMLYVSLSMAIATLDTRNTKFIESYNQEDFRFMVSEQADANQLSRWESAYNVQLEKRLVADVDFGNDATLRVIQTTDTINKAYISEGEMPTKVNEIAIAPTFADAHAIQVGDELNVRGQTLTVTGFMFLPDYIYILDKESDLLSDPNTFGIAIANEKTIQAVTEYPMIEILGDQAKDETIASLKEAVSNDFTILKWLNAEDNPRITFVESEIEGAQGVITTLPLFILALAIMMTLMIMKRRMEMQRKEIGTLMALGYRKKELLFHYMTYAALIGFIGTLGGVALGAALSVPLTNLYATFFNLPRISFFDWDVSVIIIGIILPVLLLLGMTYLVIRKPLSQAPLDLLSPKDMQAGRKSTIEKLPLFRTGSFISRFRLRLMIRSKARAIYIFLGVMFSTILLIYGFITYNAMDELVDTTYEDIYTYDYAVYYNTLQQEELDEGASGFTSSEITIDEVNGEKTQKENHKSMVFGIAPDTTFLQLLNNEGHSLTSKTKEGIVVSLPLATMENIEVGDTLTIRNSFNDRALTEEVVGITNVYVGNYVYSEHGKVNEFLGYPLNTYTAIWTEEAPITQENILFLEDKQDVIDNFESTSAMTRYSIIVIAGIAFLIGVIVLTLITNLIVEENGPSISLLKVMGYKDKEISKLVVNVYSPIVLIAYVCSVPIGMWSIEAMMASIVEQTGFYLPVNLSLWMVIIGFLIIMFTYYTSLFFSRKKLAKISLQEALNKQQD